MKIFRRILLTVVVLTITYSANSQCFIKANASPTTICAGQGVFLKSFGSCSYLMNNNFNNQTLGVGWQSTAANPVFTNPCGPGPNAWHAWVGTTA
ncbi:MAG: hypothetical protein JXR34_00760, partial [Bacteroidales bacterium]|nr:hypothetical protein [Bacteroidales bacterium]